MCGEGYFCHTVYNVFIKFRNSKIRYISITNHYDHQGNPEVTVKIYKKIYRSLKNWDCIPEIKLNGEYKPYDEIINLISS